MKLEDYWEYIDAIIDCREIMKHDLKPEDILIRPYPPRTPPGGQKVGVPMPGVEVEHIPTGLLIRVTHMRSRWACQDLALTLMGLALDAK